MAEGSKLGVASREGEEARRKKRAEAEARVIIKEQPVRQSLRSSRRTTQEKRNNLQEEIEHLPAEVEQRGTTKVEDPQTFREERAEKRELDSDSGSGEAYGVDDEQTSLLAKAAPITGTSATQNQPGRQGSRLGPYDSLNIFDARPAAIASACSAPHIAETSADTISAPTHANGGPSGSIQLHSHSPTGVSQTSSNHSTTPPSTIRFVPSTIGHHTIQSTHGHGGCEVMALSGHVVQENGHWFLQLPADVRREHSVSTSQRTSSPSPQRTSSSSGCNSCSTSQARTQTRAGWWTAFLRVSASTTSQATTVIFCDLCPLLVIGLKSQASPSSS